MCRVSYPRALRWIRSRPRFTSAAHQLPDDMRNVTINGQTTDLGSGVGSLEEQLDNGSFAPVTFDSGGSFSFSTGLALDGSGDGTHVVQLRATDNVGNVSEIVCVPFTLDTSVPSIQIVSPTVARNGQHECNHRRASGRRPLRIGGSRRASGWRSLRRRCLLILQATSRLPRAWCWTAARTERIRRGSRRSMKMEPCRRSRATHSRWTPSRRP